MKKREEQHQWEKILSKISGSLININPQNHNRKMKRILSLLGTFLKIDRAYIFTFNKELTLMHCSFQWYKDKSAVINRKSLYVPIAPYSWGLKILDNGAVCIQDVDLMPNIPEKQLLLSQKVLSSLNLPLKSSKRIYGYFRFDSILHKNIWEDEYIHMLNLLGNILVDGIVKVEAEKKMLQLAYHDTLTMLPNRFKIVDIIEDLIKNTTLDTPLFAVLFLDIDSFKNINDSLGHDAGDILIKQVALSLVEGVHSDSSNLSQNEKENMCINTNRVCRTSGDEFIVIFDNLKDANDIYQRANKLFSLFKKTYSIKNQDFYITASAGIALYPFDGDNANELIKNADIAMYKAKELGRNQFVICSEELREEIFKKAVLTNDLNKAIEKDELFLMYQPQVDMLTNKIVGVEALIRWKHPILGVVSPSTFIPIAEKTGLILPIGDWILQTALGQLKAWHDKGLEGIGMSINLSIAQFISSQLTKNIFNVLDTNEISPHLLELEITESVFSTKKDSFVMDALKAFREKGIKVSIDDFGTHYSSLSRLKEMPIDTLKIAMEFVQNLQESPKNQEITNIIVHMGKILNLKLIAEGVETAWQLEFLKERKVDIVQGYYFFKPMMPDEIEKALKKELN